MRSLARLIPVQTKEFRRRLAIAMTNLRWRQRERCRHLARAWRYARSNLTADDAQTMILECRDPAGWHPLVVLTVDDALASALETLEDHPDLPRLIADGCSRVGDKWEDFSDTLAEARRWAIELAQDYAQMECIDLLLRSDDDDPPPDGAEL